MKVGGWLMNRQIECSDCGCLMDDEARCGLCVKALRDQLSEAEKNGRSCVDCHFCHFEPQDGDCQGWVDCKIQDNKWPFQVSTDDREWGTDLMKLAHTARTCTDYQAITSDKG